jgi:hypothetical protein
MPTNVPCPSGVEWPAGLLRRKELAIDIIEGEIRSAQREVWLSASRLVLTPGESIEIPRKMRAGGEDHQTGIRTTSRQRGSGLASPTWQYDDLLKVRRPKDLFCARPA